MSSSRSPRKPSAHHLRTLERRVARLERQLATPAPVQPTMPAPVSPLPSYAVPTWQRCPLCGMFYQGIHACWTWNPRLQPYCGAGTIVPPLPDGWHISTSTTAAYWNGSTWAKNNEGSGGTLH